MHKSDLWLYLLSFLFNIFARCHVPLSGNSVEKVFHVLDHSRKNFNDGILLDNNPMTVGSV